MKSKVVNLLRPTDRRWLFSTHSSQAWNRDLFKALVALKDIENQAVFVPSKDSKGDICRAHRLGQTYQFKVSCRPTPHGFLVWLRSPGINPQLLKRAEEIGKA